MRAEGGAPDGGAHLFEDFERLARRVKNVADGTLDEEIGADRYKPPALRRWRAGSDAPSPLGLRDNCPFGRFWSRINSIAMWIH